MPIYTTKSGDLVEFNSRADAARFEREYPDATVDFILGDQHYDVPLQHIEGFQKRHPEADYWSSTRANQAEPKPNTQEEKQSLWDSVRGLFGKNNQQEAVQPPVQQAATPIAQDSYTAVSDTTAPNNIPVVQQPIISNGTKDLNNYVGNDGSLSQEQRRQFDIQGKLREAYLMRDELSKKMEDEFSGKIGWDILPEGLKEFMRKNKSSDLGTAYRANEERIRTLEAAKDKEDSGFFKGIDDELLKNPAVQTFGLSSLRDMLNLAGAKNVIDNTGTNTLLSEDQRLMLENQVKNTAAQEEYADELSNSYRYGKIAANALPFVAEFLLTGGFGNVATTGAALGRLAGSKTGNAALKWMLRSTGTLAGDVAAAAAMANTTGAAKTASDVIGRYLGGVVQDENGNYDFKGGKSLGRSFYEGEMAYTLEYYTEMLGEHIPLGKIAGKVSDKLGLSKLAKSFEGITANGWYKVGKAILDRAQIQSYPSEVLEEEANIVLNSLLVGDQKLSDLVDKRTQSDILGGMLFSIGFMNSLPMTAGAIGEGINRGMYYRQKNKVNNADRMAGTSMTEEKWQPLREQIDSTPNEQFADMFQSIISDASLQDNEKRAAINYMTELTKLRGYNMGEIAKAKDAIENGVTPEQQASMDADTSYSAGYEASDEQKNELKNQYEAALEDLPGNVDATNVDNNPMEYLRNMEAAGASADEKQRVLDYINAKAAYDGMINRVQDDIDSQIAASDEQVNQQVNATSGMVQPVVLKNGNRQVYVVNGNLVMNEDGTINLENSQQDVIVRDKETGKLEFVPISDIAAADAPINPDELKAANAEAIRQTKAQEQSAIIDGTLAFAEGDTYQAVGEDGTPVDVTVISQNEDGTLNVGINGEASAEPMTKEALQQMVDRYKLQQAQTANIERRAAQQMETATAGRTYQLNEQVPVTLPDGTPGTAFIQSEPNADGQYEVELQDSYGTVRGVSLMSQQQLNDMEATQPEAEEPIPTPTPVNSVQSNEQPTPVEEAISETSNQPEVDENAMPMIGEGEDAEPDYGAVSPQRTHQYIYQESGLSENDADQLVQVKKKEADDLLNNAKKDEPKFGDKGIGSNINKFKNAHQEWEGKVADAQRQVDYWNAVEQEQAMIVRQLEAAAEAEVQQDNLNTLEQESQEEAPKETPTADTTPVIPEPKKPEQKKSKKKEEFTPRNLEELAAYLLGDNSKRGIKLIRQDWKNETGYGDEEAKKFFPIFAKKENGGITISKAGDLLQEYAADMGIPFDDTDPNAGRNAIISIFQQGNEKWTDLKNYIKNSRQAEERQIDEYEEELRDLWYLEHFGVNYEDYESGLYDELMDAVGQEYADVPEDIYEQIIDEDNTLNTESNGRDTEEEAGIEGSSAVLQGTQSVLQGRNGEAEGQSEEAVAGVRGENEAVPESASRSEVEQHDGYTVEPYTYTKKNGSTIDMLLVKFDNLDDDTKKKLSSAAREMKGWWSREDKGFLLRSRDDVQKLADIANEDIFQMAERISNESEKETENLENSQENDNFTLTLEALENSDLDEFVKSGARAWINGDKSPANQLAYLAAVDYVRSFSENHERGGGNADIAQLGSTDNGVASRENGRGNGESGLVDTENGGEGISTDATGREDSTPDVASSNGEGGDRGLFGNPSEPNGDIASGESTGSSTTGSKRGNGRGRGQQGGSRVSGKDAGRGTKAAARAELDDALSDFEKILKESFTEPVKGKMLAADPVSLYTYLGAVKAIKLLSAGSRVAYAAVKLGYYEFKDWYATMKSKLGDMLRNIAGMTDDQIDGFIEMMWDYSLTIDGETHKISEWASIIGDEKLRDQVSMTIEEKRKLQKQAEDTPTIIGDITNIRESLPFLLPKQQDDVQKAERQFFSEDHQDAKHGHGKGYMFTNGTGTGKTYTGLGIIKRFLKQGKKRILIVTAQETKIKDWINDAKNLGIDASMLPDTKSKGSGIVVTQYANIRQNRALLEDVFDLIVYDESHKIMENQDGMPTSTSRAHHMLANRDERQAARRILMAGEFGKKIEDAENELDLLQQALDIKTTEWSSDVKKAYQEVTNSGKSVDDRVKELREIVEKLEDTLEKEVDNYLADPEHAQEARDAAKKTKVVFLSATPFNTPANLDYAEGYTFSYTNTDDVQKEVDRMKSRDNFLVEHFNASHQRNQKTQSVGRIPQERIPDPLKASEEEVVFSDYMQNDLETMSGRDLDSEYDYSREFPKLDFPMADTFNDAIQSLSDGRFNILAPFFDHLLKDYNTMTGYLEIFKAQMIAPRIRQYVDLGKKVTLFHRRKASNTDMYPPFSLAMQKAMEQSVRENDEDIEDAVESFKEVFGSLFKWENSIDYMFPQDSILREFMTDKEEADYQKANDEWVANYGEELQKLYAQRMLLNMQMSDDSRDKDKLLEEIKNINKSIDKIAKLKPKAKCAIVSVFNGSEAQKDRDAAVRNFNDDKNKTKVLVVQVQSGKEGISLHDTTGEHPRVQIGIFLPQSPIEFIQTEGRIFRVGNKSNAIFEYPLLGLDIELSNFALKINGRSETTENLALGSRGRGLKESISRSALASRHINPQDAQGIGGKELDNRKAQQADGFTTAMQNYDQWRTDVKPEDVNDIEIPDPIGFMMVKWANPDNGERVLVPNARRGSVARYVPTRSRMTAMEWRNNEFARLTALVGGSGRKVLNESFDDHSNINKYDLVVVNTAHGIQQESSGLGLGEPVSSDAKDAMKAIRHLEDSGRAIMLVSSDRVKDILASIKGSRDTSTMVPVAEVKLPSFVLNGIPSSILVVDRVDNKELRAQVGEMQTIDLSEAKDENTLYAQIRDVVVPNRNIDKAGKITRRLRPMVNVFVNTGTLAQSKNYSTNKMQPDISVRDGYMDVRFKRGKMTFFTWDGHAYRGFWINGKLIANNNVEEITSLAKEWVNQQNLLSLSDEDLYRKYRNYMPYDANVGTMGAIRDTIRAIAQSIELALDKTPMQIRNIAEGKVENEVSGSYDLNGFREVFDSLNADDAGLEALANKVFDAVSKIDGLQFRVVSGNAFRSGAGHNVVAHYVPSQNIIELNSDVFNSIRTTDEFKAQTIVHEMIHALTTWALNAYDNERTRGQLTKQQQEACKIIKDVFAQINNDAFRFELRKNSKIEDNAEYGLTNEHEMMAELANPVFRAMLKAKNLWRQLINGIKMLLGIEIPGIESEKTDALTELENALETLIDNFDPELYKRFTQGGNYAVRNYMMSQKAGAETNAPIQQETELRDALADLMRQAGIEVIDDIEEGQRVLDEAGDKAKPNRGKKITLEPVSVSSEEEHLQSVDSSAGTKVINNLDTLAKELEKKTTPPIKTFIGEVSKAIGARKYGSNSQYATFKTKNEQIVTIRLADHNAHTSGFDQNNRSNGISIVITPKKNMGIDNDGFAHVVEFYYDAIKLRRAEGKPLADIVRSIQQVLYSGEYKDTTGLAEREEMNANMPRFSKAPSEEPFYSNALKAVQDIKQEKATPEQWLKMIEKNGGLKAGEDKWTGLSDWLKNSNAKTLTKQDVMDYINQNQIQIEEQGYVEYSDNAAKRLADFNDEFHNVIAKLIDENPEMNRNDATEMAYDEMKERYGDDFELAFELTPAGNGDFYLSPALNWNDEPSDAAKHFLENDGNRTIHGIRLDYTTRGLENKREIALTIPTIESWNEGDTIHFGDAGEGRAVAWVRFGDTTIDVPEDGGAAEAEFKRIMRDNDKWYDEHPDFARYGIGDESMKQESEERKQRQRDALAAAEAVPKHTEKVLVIDEIQSKRHQEGRESGYKSELASSPKGRWVEAVKSSDSFSKEMRQKYGGNYLLDQLTEEERKRHEELVKELNEASNYQDEKLYNIPDAPFEKNWHELAMKRMLRYAAENGYDKIAWTTGAQQADRYDIGKKINDIIVSPAKDGGKLVSLNFRHDEGYMDFYQMQVNDDGKIIEGDFDGNNLSDIVGKDLAVKLLASNGRQVFANENLRVGGEGMRGFYDEMLPRFMNKYGKKWGVKVEDVKIPRIGDGYHGLTMHSVDVTPEMRESVMQGQPMFFRTSDGQAYGYTLNGKIYIDPRIATAETPIHEFAHLWAEALRNGNNKEWQNVANLMKGTPIWDDVKKRYPELKTDDEVAEEVLAHYSGQRGAERLRKAQAEAMNNADGVFEKAEIVTMFDNVRRALSRFWKAVADFLNIHYTSAEEVADRVMYDLLSGVNPSSVTGKSANSNVRSQKVKDAAIDTAAIEQMSDEQLLENIDLGGAYNDDPYAIEYDDRHQDDYDAYYAQAEEALVNEKPEVEVANDRLSALLKQWRRLYNTDQRIPIWAQINALDSYIAVEEAKYVDAQVPEEFTPGVQPKQENSDTTTYITTKGKEVEYQQLSLDFTEDTPQNETTEEENPAGIDLTKIRLRPLKEGETCHVERRFTRDNTFTLTGGKNKIESPDDIAYIFRCLEDKAIEHAFIVLVKDGQPTIVHVGMGSIDNTTVDSAPLTVLAEEMKPDHIYFVHNHPSGNLKPSKEDIALTDMMHFMVANVPMTNMIIDTYKHQYRLFNGYEADAEGNVPDNANEAQNIPLFTFDETRFEEGFSPVNIKNSSDIFNTVYGLRFGEEKKMGYMVLDRAFNLLGNLYLDADSVDAISEDVIRDMLKNATLMKGSCIALYGTADLKKDVFGKMLDSIKRLSGNYIRVLDVLELKGNNGDYSGFYSFHDHGVMDDVEAPYGFEVHDSGYEPTKTGKGYKVFVLKDGKLYPPMVANPNGEATPVNEWLTANAAPVVSTSKTGRPQVKAGGKGTQGGSGTLAYRPGWHLGEIPYAVQFNRKNANGEKNLFPKNFVWAEVDYANDVDYQDEARKEGINENGKYQHSLAGLKKVPANGSYRYRTNPNPNTDEWIITGAMKVNRILTPSEVDAMVMAAGREPQQRQDGAVTDEQVQQLNENLGLANNAIPAMQAGEDIFSYAERVAEADRQRRERMNKKNETAEDIDNEERLSHAEAVEVANQFEKENKGAGKTIILDTSNGRDGMIQQLMDEGITRATAERWLDRDDIALYSPYYDRVVIFNSNVGKTALNRYLWHENVHRAIAKAFGSDANRRIDITYRKLFLLTPGTMELDKLVRDAYKDASEQEIKEEFLTHLFEAAVESSYDVETYMDKTIEARGKDGNLSMLKEIVNYVKYGNKEGNNNGRPSGSSGRLSERSEEERTDEVRNTERADTGKETERAAKGVTTSPLDIEKAAARGAYEAEVTSKAYEIRESLQDSMRGLHALYKAVLGDEFKHIEDVPEFENAYLAENRMSSKNLAEQTEYVHKYLNPLLDAVHKLAGSDEEGWDELSDYMMAKHGLERNKVLAERDARRVSEDWKRDALAENEANLKRSISELKDKLSHGLIDQDAFDNKKAELELMAEAAREGIRQEAERMYFAEAAENRKKDYAGLTALTGNEPNEVAAAEAEAQRMVDEYENSHDADDIKDLWDKTRAATHNTLEKTYKSGLQSKDSYENTLNMFEYYVPLRGFAEKTSDQVYDYLMDDSGPLKGSVLKTAEGRRSKADNPIVYIAQMANKAIMEGNRNRMKQKFLNFVTNHPSDLVSVSDLWVGLNDATGEWEALFPSIDPTDTTEIAEQKMQEFEERMNELKDKYPDKYKRVKENPNIPYRILNNNLREHQVLVKRNGVPTVVTINSNPRAAQALNGMTNPDSNMSRFLQFVNTAVGEILRFMSNVYTSANPEFVLSNFLRDFSYSATISFVKENANYAAQFEKNRLRFNPLIMHRLFRKFENGTLDDSNKIERLFHQFMLNGGETGYTNVLDIAGHRKEIVKALKMKDATAARKILKAIAEQYDMLNRSVENVARFAAFVTSREMGRTIGRSIWDAKEISVNFNKKGSADKFFNTEKSSTLGNIASGVSTLMRLTQVFFNAAVQALTNVVRAGKRNPKKFSALASGLAAIGLMQPIIAELFSGGGDGDDDDEYYNIPEYVRRSHIMIRIPGTNNWAMLPLTQEYRAIFGLGEMLSGMITGKETYDPAEAAGKVAALISQALPVDMLEGAGGIGKLVPSQAQPIYEAWVNKDWTGLPIYRKDVFPGEENKPEWTRVYKSADQTLVGLSKALNELTGGEGDFKQGWADINPAVVEHIMEGYFGGYWNTVMKTKKTAETLLGERDFDPRNIFLLSRVMYRSDERTQGRKTKELYYKYKEEAEKTKQIVKGYENQEEAGIEGAAEKADFYYLSDEYGRYQIYEKYRPEINAARKSKNEAEKEGDETEAKLYSEEENDLMKQMVEEMEQFNKERK